MITPLVILEEILRYREASLADTRWFREKKHDKDLCPAVEGRLQELIDYFLKYHAIVNTIQGLRDHGVDVLLRYALSSDPTQDENVVGIQIKSFDDIKRGNILKELKAQYFDAVDRYGNALERYFILLCTDEAEQWQYVRNIAAEFSKDKRIRVITPKFSYTFLHLREEIVSATVDRFLRDEDYLHAQAKQEIIRLSPIEFALVISALVSTTTGDQHSFIPEKMVLDLPPELEIVVENYIGREIQSDELTDAYMQLEGYPFIRQSAYSDTVEMAPDSYPALRCLLLDATVRYNLRDDRLRAYMYEGFCRSALGKPIET
jgi:uncharacterized protein DUF4365